MLKGKIESKQGAEKLWKKWNVILQLGAAARVLFQVSDAEFLF